MNCFMSFLNNLISMEDSTKNSILIFCIWGSDICWNGVRVDRMLTPDSCDDSGDEPTLLWFNFMQHSMLWLLKGCNITINCCLCWRFKLKMIFGSNIIQTLLTLGYRITCDMCQQGIIEALILNCTTNTIHYHFLIPLFFLVSWHSSGTFQSPNIHIQLGNQL